LKDYYQILHVRRGAAAAEIRKAYRILVQQLHPDVNPNPAAHELIKEVNEAYDVLGDAAKKEEYDYRLDNPYSTLSIPQEPVHRDPAYRRKRNYRPAQPDPQLELMQRYLHLAKKIAWAGCVLCFVLAIDFSVPHRVTSDTVETFRSTRNRRSSQNYVVTHSNRHLKISDRDLRLFEIDQKIEIIESRLFSILIAIRIADEGVRITNLSTLYANYIFVVVLLLILSFIPFVFKGTVESKFNLGIVSFFVLIFTLILLLK
jgi:hypothetical protein